MSLLASYIAELRAGLAEQANLPAEAYTYLQRSFKPELLDWVPEALWLIQTVPLSKIHLHAHLVDKSLINKFRRKFIDGDPVHPIVLMADGTGYAVADGRHRALGAKAAGKKAIKAWVAHPGDKPLPVERIVQVEHVHGEAQTQAQ